MKSQNWVISDSEGRTVLFMEITTTTVHLSKVFTSVKGFFGVLGSKLNWEPFAES